MSIFVMGDDYDNIIETIAGLESKIGWRHDDNDAEKRNNITECTYFGDQNHCWFLFRHTKYSVDKGIVS